MLAISKLQDQFAFGDCATFAVALSRYYRLPIVDLYECSDNYIHSMVYYNQDISTNESIYLDSYGKNTCSTLKNRYGLSQSLLYESSELNLSKISSIDNFLLPLAYNLIDVMIKLKLLPSSESSI